MDKDYAELLSRLNDIHNMTIQEAEFFVESLKCIAVDADDTVAANYLEVMSHLGEAIETVRKKYPPNTKMGSIKNEVCFDKPSVSLEKFLNDYQCL